MIYRSGTIGRIFNAKMEHGDDLMACLKNLIETEKLEAAVFFLLGAIKQGQVVVGPREAIIPPDPVIRVFNDGREIIALGTSFRDENGEAILHIHGSLGRADTVITGCLREKNQVYLVVEAVIMEICGSGSQRILDEKLGIKTLSFKQTNE